MQLKSHDQVVFCVQIALRSHSTERWWRRGVLLCCFMYFG